MFQLLNMMKNNRWLIEMEFAVCVLAVAGVAFALMVGHAVWNTWFTALPQNSQRTVGGPTGHRLIACSTMPGAIKQEADARQDLLGGVA
jgi:hypothetical protein